MASNDLPADCADNILVTRFRAGGIFCNFRQPRHMAAGNRHGFCGVCNDLIRNVFAVQRGAVRSQTNVQAQRRTGFYNLELECKQSAAFCNRARCRACIAHTGCIVQIHCRVQCHNRRGCRIRNRCICGPVELHIELQRTKIRILRHGHRHCDNIAGVCRGLVRSKRERRRGIYRKRRNGAQAHQSKNRQNADNLFHSLSFLF